MSKTNRITQIIGWIAVCLIIVLVLPIFQQLAPPFYRAEEVDIRSGEIRYSRYVLWWCPVSRRVSASAISRELGLSATSVTPDWRMVNKFGPGSRYSQHYAFHGAFVQMRDLAGAWQFGNFTPAARQESAKRLLAAWQQGQRNEAATEFVIAVMGLAEPGKPIDVDDLPK